MYHEEIIFNVDDKQAYLALHVMSYQIMAALRLYKKEKQIGHQNECNDIDYRIARIKDRPNFIEREKEIFFSSQELSELVELYESLDPVFYLFGKYFPGYAFVFEWLRKKVSNNPDVKTYKTCWCVGCPNARELDVERDGRFHTHIPPRVEKLGNTGVTPPAAGIFMTHDKIKKRLEEAEADAITSPEKFHAFYDGGGYEKLLKQPFTE